MQELLHFQGQALQQFVLVASIFGAFSMSGVIALIASHEKASLRSVLFVLLSFASLAFIFSTVVAVTIMPFMSEGVHVTDDSARGLLVLYRVAVLSILLGTMLLFAGLAGVGFMVSRRVGRWTLIAAICTTIGFGWCIYYLKVILH